jgi:hypothetical protein
MSILVLHILLSSPPRRRRGRHGKEGVREHSGNVDVLQREDQGRSQGTFREESGRIKGGVREHSGNVDVLQREDQGWSQATFREESGNIQGT